MMSILKMSCLMIKCGLTIQHIPEWSEMCFIDEQLINRNEDITIHRICVIEFFPHYIGHLEKCKMAITPQESILYPSFMCPFISLQFCQDFAREIRWNFEGHSMGCATRGCIWRLWRAAKKWCVSAEFGHSAAAKVFGVFTARKQQ